jgi:hypothetical protein
MAMLVVSQTMKQTAESAGTKEDLCLLKGKEKTI